MRRNRENYSTLGTAIGLACIAATLAGGVMLLMLAWRGIELLWNWLIL
jgi:hypothetical protein